MIRESVGNITASQTQRMQFGQGVEPPPHLAGSCDAVPGRVRPKETGLFVVLSHCGPISQEGRAEQGS